MKKLTHYKKIWPHRSEDCAPVTTGVCNRLGVRHRKALVCRWHRDPQTGRPVCRWVHEDQGPEMRRVRRFKAA